MKDLHPGIAPPFVGSGIFQARFRFVALSSGANQPEKHRNPTGGLNRTDTKCFIGIWKILDFFNGR